MFLTGNKVYTDEDIYIQDDRLVFEAFKAYVVYATEEDGMHIPCIISEDGLLHDIKKVGHMFRHQH